MKLDTFKKSGALVEAATVTREQFREFDHFDNVAIDQAFEITEKIRKQFKFQKIETLNDGGGNNGEDQKPQSVRMHFTNNVLNLELSFRLFGNTSKGTPPSILLRATIEIIDDYLIDPSKHASATGVSSSKPHNYNVLASTMVALVNGPLDSTAEKEFGAIENVLREFIEWYFDVSGEYGKVKLLKTATNIFDNSYNTNISRWVAVAGQFVMHSPSDFTLNSNTGKVDVERAVF